MINVKHFLSNMSSVVAIKVTNAQHYFSNFRNETNHKSRILTRSNPAFSEKVTAFNNHNDNNNNNNTIKKKY